jgi:hypothetical protein
MYFVGIELTHRTHRNTCDEFLLLVRLQSLGVYVITDRGCLVSNDQLSPLSCRRMTCHQKPWVIHAYPVRAPMVIHPPGFYRSSFYRIFLWHPSFADQRCSPSIECIAMGREFQASLQSFEMPFAAVGRSCLYRYAPLQ